MEVLHNLKELEAPDGELIRTILMISHPALR